MTYTMRQARDIIDYAVMNPLPNGQHRVIYLEGDPGLGKTALAHSVYAKYRRYKNETVKQDRYWRREDEIALELQNGKGWEEVDNINFTGGFTHFVAYVAPERDVTDWGLPFPSADRKNIAMLPLEDFDYKPGDRPFILLDEIDKAMQMMQNVLGRVMHEQRIGNIVFPAGTFVMAAGNKMSNRAGSVAANTHIKNRRTHVPVNCSATEWIEDVAIPWDLHWAVISYLRTDPEMIHKLDTNNPSFPSPRSWTKVASTLNDNIPSELGHVERALIEGDIGVETSNIFWGHLAICRKIRPIEEFIANPDKIKTPRESKDDAWVAVTYAELSALAKHATPKTVDAICRYFNRLDAEYAFCGYRDMLLRDKQMVLTSKAGMTWATKNADMLIRTK